MRRMMMVVVLVLVAASAMAQQGVTSDQRRLYTGCVSYMEQGARKAYMQDAGVDVPDLYSTTKEADLCIQLARHLPLSPELMRKFESLVDTYRSAITAPSAAAAGVEASKGADFLARLN